MRQDLRKLQKIVRDYLRENQLTHEEFAARGAPELNRGKLGYLINGKASAMDVLLLAAFARALRVPFPRLAAEIGVMSEAASDERGDRLLAEAVQLSSQLEGVDRDIFLDKLEQLVETSKRKSAKSTV